MNPDKLKEYYDSLDRNGGCWSSLAFYSVLVMLFLTIASCTKTVYVPTPEYHEIRDTIIKKEIVEKEVIKEVAVKDSSSFHQSGDTVRIEHWHYERDYTYEKALQAKVDSLTKLSRDTVPVPVEVPVVTNVLKPWQKGLMWWGVITTLAFVVILYIKMRFLHKH